MGDILDSPLEVLQTALANLKATFEAWQASIASKVYEVQQKLEDIAKTLENAVLDAASLTTNILSQAKAVLDLAVSDLKTQIATATTYAKDQASAALKTAEMYAYDLVDDLKTDVIKELDIIQARIQTTIDTVKAVAEDALARVSKLETILNTPAKFVDLMASSISGVW